MTMSHITTSRRTIARAAPATQPVCSGRRERRKAECRQRLFRAALQLFATRGFNATTVEDITRAADVAKGTFFNYYPTKELLLSDLVEVRLDILRAAREEARQGRRPLHDILRGTLCELMKEPGRSRAIARCMLLGPLSSEQVATLAERIVKQGRQILSEVMRIGQQRKEIRQDWDAAELARLFQQSFFGVLHLWTIHPKLDLAHCLDKTFALFWAGVESRPGHSRKKPS
jgi:AcrR family transcriptional regulator